MPSSKGRYEERPHYEDRRVDRRQAYGSSGDYDEMRALTRDYYFSRYGREKVQWCADTPECAHELDRVGRSGSRLEMDRFFASF